MKGWALGLLLVVMPSVSGCRLARSAADLPTQAVRMALPASSSKAPANPVELQQALLPLADDFAERMVVGIDKLNRAGEPLPQAQTLRYKLGITSKIYGLASGSHGPAALVELTVLATATRTALDNDLRGNSFGASSEWLAHSTRVAESNLWQLIQKTLPAPQVTELQLALGKYQDPAIQLDDILATSVGGNLALLANAPRDETARPESVFSLLRIDPLSGVDPAVRELARSRLLAERALFVLQRMPRLLRWQTELLAVDSTDIPAVKQLLNSSTDLNATLARFAAVAEQLPVQVARERAEILSALESQESRLLPLTHEVRQTLDSGTHMSMALNDAIATLDDLLRTLGVGGTNTTPAEPASPQAEPFRVQDYGDAAAKIGEASRQLRDLVAAVDALVAPSNVSRLAQQVNPVVDRAQLSGKELVDYAFIRGIALIGLALIAGIAFRYFSVRLLPRSLPLDHSRSGNSGGVGYQA